MEQGIFQKSNGRGTYLRQFPIVLESGLKELTSVTEHIRKVGAKPSTQGIQTDKIPADKQLGQKLQLPRGTSCYWIEKVCFADDVTAAYCIDVIPENLLPDRLKEQGLSGFTLRTTEPKWTSSFTYRESHYPNSFD